MANFWDADAIVAPPARGQGADWWSGDSVTQAAPSVAADVAKSAGIGAAEGLIGLAALNPVLPGGGELSNAMRSGGAYAADQTIGRLVNLVRSGTGAATTGAREWAARSNEANPSSAANLRKAIEAQTGEFYRPQTTAGEVARTIGTYAPNALAPGTAFVRGAMVAVPGLADEIAGRATRGSALEPIARGAAGLIGTGGVALAARPAYSTVRTGRAVANVTEPEFGAAQQLMRDAEARGISITPAEALQQTTRGGAMPMATLQRQIEARPGGSEIMGPFMARRGGQVERAVAGQLDEIAPTLMDPGLVTGRVRDAANEMVSGTRRAINEQTRPLYDAASAARVPEAEMALLRQHPSFSRALAAIRNDPELSVLVGSQPDSSVAVVDKVKQLLSQESRRLGRPTSDAQFAGARSAVMGEAAQAARIVGERVSPEYAQALAEQTRLRRDVLAPLQAGPVGDITRATTPRGVVSALFPEAPLPGTAESVGTAAAGIRTIDPEAAAGIARTGIQDIWEQAASGGGRSGAQAAQFTGADFAKRLRGPRGETALQVVRQAAATPEAEARTRRLLEILGATGERQPAGSQTAYNAAADARDARGGLVGLLTGAGKPATVAREAVQQRRLEGRAGELARILTAPPDVAIPALREAAQRVNRADRDTILGFLLGLNNLRSTYSIERPRN